MKTDYKTQAEQFLKETGTSMEVKFLRYGKHFDDDKESRDVYSVTLKRGQRAFTFNFGQSINASGTHWLYGDHKKGVGRSRSMGVGLIINYVNSIYNGNEGKTGERILSCGNWDKNPNFSSPSAYDILACLTKSDVGTFENFCADFGYDTDSRKAEKIYHAVVNEWQNICMLWNEQELIKLQEIN